METTGLKYVLSKKRQRKTEVNGGESLWSAMRVPLGTINHKSSQVTVGEEIESI